MREFGHLCEEMVGWGNGEEDVWGTRKGSGSGLGRRKVLG